MEVPPRKWSECTGSNELISLGKRRSVRPFVRGQLSANGALILQDLVHGSGQNEIRVLRKIVRHQEIPIGARLDSQYFQIGHRLQTVTGAPRDAADARAFVNQTHGHGTAQVFFLIFFHVDAEPVDLAEDPQTLCVDFLSLLPRERFVSIGFDVGVESVAQVNFQRNGSNAFMVNFDCGRIQSAVSFQHRENRRVSEGLNIWKLKTNRYTKKYPELIHENFY